jgi:hypothetical protein
MRSFSAAGSWLAVKHTADEITTRKTLRRGMTKFDLICVGSGISQPSPAVD